MKKIKKVHNAKIIFIITSAVLLFTNTLYASFSSKESLRIPIGNYNRLTELLPGKNSNQLSIYGSMDNMLEGLRLEIPKKLRQADLSDADVGSAEQLLDMVGEVYNSMGLLTKNYHNHVHNLAATYAILLLTGDLNISVEDKKVLFIASLFHDFQVRTSIDEETKRGTPAFLEETLRQFADILGIAKYPGPSVANARYLGENSIISQHAKLGLKNSINRFLGSEKTTKELYPKIVAMIRRTDFASDVPQPHGAYKQKALDIRRMMDGDIKKGIDIGKVIKMVDTEYIRVLAEIENDKSVENKQKDIDRAWIKRQEGIELAYLGALEEMKTPAEVQLFHELSCRLEKGADQAGLYYLGKTNMVELGVVQGLHTEIPNVTVAGSYPFFFDIEFLTPEVLNILRNLPMEYKNNFCEVMGYFSKLSIKAGENMSENISIRPLFLNAENEWSKKSAKIAYMLGMSVDLSKQSLLGGFLNEEEIGRLISEMKLTMYNSGINILKKGDSVGETGVYEILSGRANVIIDGKIIAVLNKGDTFGEMAVIKNDKRTATIVAEEDSVIAEIPSETFLYFYNNNDKFHSYINGLIEARSKMNEEKNHSLNGPFLASGTRILYYAYEVLDNAEIEKALQKWFSRGKNRYFEWNRWNFLIQHYVYKKDHPNGFLIKLQSRKGEILGLAFFHKVNNFMFSRDEEMQTEDIAPIYFFDLMEVAEEYRGKGLGKVLLAKGIEKSINDPDIEDRVILTEPATRGPHSSDNFFETIEASPMYIVKEGSIADLFEADDETVWKARHRLLDREIAIKLFNKVKNRVIAEQLNLFSKDELDGLKVKSKIIAPVQLNLFEDKIVVMEQLRKNPARGSL
jgi:CRP-like cAMP-binding protein/GNAT superfamily N-acetyltransferase